MRRVSLMFLAVIVWLPLTLSATPTPALNEFYWSPVTLRADGAPLTDLAGYRIYCGTSGEVGYPIAFEIANPSATTLPIVDVVHEDGHYYCSITAFSGAGLESQYSEQINFFLKQGQVLNPATPAVPSSFGVR